MTDEALNEAAPNDPTTGNPVVELTTDNLTTPAVAAVDPNTASASEVAPPAEPEPPAKVAKRFSEVTKRAQDAEKQAQEANHRLSLALEALERVTPKATPAADPVTVEDPEPVAPEFLDPEQYQQDMAAYTKAVTERAVRQGLKAAEAEAKTKAAAELEATQQQAQQRAWVQRREQAMAELPDYVEVAERPDVAISQAMAVAIASDELGPKLAYHLGQHPEEAERISNLTVPQQLMALGVLKAQLSQVKVAVSKAPPPIKPLGGSAQPQVKTIDEMSMEEYAAQRRSRTN